MTIMPIMNRYMTIVLFLCWLVLMGVASATDTETFHKLRDMAEKGDAKAQYRLGMAYYEGTAISRNFGMAMRWFEKAAMQGHAKAQHRMAVCYNNGEGTLHNRIKAFAWYLVAAENKHPQAQSKSDAYKSILTRQQLIEGRRLAADIKQNITKLGQRENN